MIPKLIILTECSWWNTDITVIPQLMKKFDVEVFLVAEKSTNKFTSEEIQSFQNQFHIKVNVWPRRKRIRSPYNLFYFFKLFSILHKKINEPNTWIYYVSMYDPYINFYLLFLNRSNTLIGTHDYKTHEGMDSVLRRIIKKMNFYWYNYFQFFSINENSHFKLDYPQKKSFFIDMPLKTYGNHIVDLKIGIKSPLKVFLFFGLIRHYKGLDILLKAINHELLSEEKFILVIAGYSDDFAFYQTLLEPVKDKVYLKIEFIDNNLIPSYFNFANFLILPYRTATQSGPLLLGINYNLPVIASNLECFKGLITHGVDGYLFEKEDVYSLAQCMYSALILTDDEYNQLKKNQNKKADTITSKSSEIGNIFFDKLINNNF